MKRQITKILNKFFEPYEYDLTVGKRGTVYFLYIQADQRGRGDWRNALANCLWIYSEKDPDESVFSNQYWLLRYEPYV